jgi:hypothetical protein
MWLAKKDLLTVDPGNLVELPKGELGSLVGDRKIFRSLPKRAHFSSRI